ncbi:hypothetical protein ADUPG1_012640 [Aduncisulcus paluster]|uniref:Uncharacterized protein n=1 Tax=Aduncisulcus paluster TaxID=2918883 RepID=A0ABQ5K052_9EUKA|nr:hypothetical protein ADUPG1_012640 [Aduncisulcus paluster]
MMFYALSCRASDHAFKAAAAEVIKLIANSFVASIEDVSSSSSFSRFKNSLATMSMTLNFNGTTFSLDINDFTAYSDEPCGVDEDDMAALEERGISSSDMDSYFYRYSPFTSSDISGVSGLDFYADIELFEDSTSNLSTSKQFVISVISCTDDDGDCYSNQEHLCSYTCLSVAYATDLNIGITPKHTSTYPNTYDVSDDDVRFVNGYYYSAESFSCSSVDYLPVSSLSLNIYDITTYCGIYQAKYGGDLGDDWSTLITIGTILKKERNVRKKKGEKRAEQRQRQRAMRSSTYQPESELGDQRIDIEDKSHSPLYQPSSQPIQPLPDEVVAQGEQDESGQTFVPVSVVLDRMQAGEM